MINLIDEGKTILLEKDKKLLILAESTLEWTSPEPNSDVEEGTYEAVKNHGAESIEDDESTSGAESNAYARALKRSDKADRVSKLAMQKKTDALYDQAAEAHFEAAEAWEECWNESGHRPDGGTKEKQVCDVKNVKFHRTEQAKFERLLNMKGSRSQNPNAPMEHRKRHVQRALKRDKSTFKENKNEREKIMINLIDESKTILLENLNLASVDKALELFQDFDAEEAEKFFAELGNYYSHGSEYEADNRNFSKISDLLGEITTIIKSRKGN